MEVKSRFIKPLNSSFFLFGPRGVGKSLWLKQTFADALLIDFLSPEIFRSYTASPERLEAFVEGNAPTKTFIIDEVQKIPEVLSVVHRLIEKDKRRVFILTGSSARKLKRTGVDLLGGRAGVKTLHPFMVAELGKDFNLKKALTIGMIPLICDAADPASALEAYINLYLKEEVKMEGLVRNIGNFTRFLEMISLSHGQILVLSEIARECGVERKTVEGYLSVLEDLLLSFRVPVFTKKAKRHIISHPKFYYFDAGVFNALRPKGPLNDEADIGGVALEGLVAQQLRAFLAYRQPKADLYYWRTKSGVEVDFVMYGQDIFVGIEVKRSTKVHPKDLRGLEKFKEDYPSANVLMVYGGKERLRINNILCIGCEEFLMGLNPLKPFPFATLKK